MDQDEFCERMWPRLVTACISFTGSTAFGEYLAQEALTRALMRWKQIDAMEAPEAYVMTVAMNLGLAEMRADADQPIDTCTNVCLYERVPTFCLVSER